MKSLRIFAAFVSVCTFFLVIAGGAVTSTGSGLSVPDWPLSFGQWMPPMEGGVFFEHGHRMIAGIVGLLTVILTVWVYSAGASLAARRLALSAMMAVVIQALFGGITVLLQLPPVVSVAHACLGQIFFALTFNLAAALHWTRHGRRASDLTIAEPRLRRLAWITALFIFLQLLLGAIYRHTGLLLHAHMAGAILVFIHVFLLWRRLRRSSALVLARVGWMLLGMVWIQIGLGILAWQRPYPWLTVAHVSVGALLLALVSACTLPFERESA